MQQSLKLYFILCFSFLYLCSFFAYADNQNEEADIVNGMVVMQKAKLRILNKQLGRVDTSILDVGDSYKLDNLKITVYACYTNKEYDTSENTMFLTVKYIDNQIDMPDQDGATIFSGWMFICDGASDL